MSAASSGVVDDRVHVELAHDRGAMGLRVFTLIATLLAEISVKTVETHRAAIMRKLDMHSIVDIVHFAIRNNLVKP